MLTHAECIAKAVTLEEMTENNRESRTADLEMAISWRHLAEQAKFQDDHAVSL